jgi:hypothetical protein
MDREERQMPNTPTKDFSNIHVECRGCNKVFEIYVADQDIRAWQDGALIQNAMPYLTADERELFMTRMCGSCWEKTFQGGE